MSSTGRLIDKESEYTQPTIAARQKAEEQFNTLQSAIQALKSQAVEADVLAKLVSTIADQIESLTIFKEKHSDWNRITANCIDSLGILDTVKADDANFLKLRLFRALFKAKILELFDILNQVYVSARRKYRRAKGTEHEYAAEESLIEKHAAYLRVLADVRNYFMQRLHKGDMADFIPCQEINNAIMAVIIHADSPGADYLDLPGLNEEKLELQSKCIKSELEKIVSDKKSTFIAMAINAATEAKIISDAAETKDKCPHYLGKALQEKDFSLVNKKIQTWLQGKRLIGKEGLAVLCLDENKHDKLPEIKTALTQLLPDMLLKGCEKNILLFYIYFKLTENRKNAKKDTWKIAEFIFDVLAGKVIVPQSGSMVTANPEQPITADQFKMLIEALAAISINPNAPKPKKEKKKIERLLPEKTSENVEEIVADQEQDSDGQSAIVSDSDQGKEAAPQPEPTAEKIKPKQTQPPINPAQQKVEEAESAKAEQERKEQLAKEKQLQKTAKFDSMKEFTFQLSDRLNQQVAGANLLVEFDRKEISILVCGSKTFNFQHKNKLFAVTRESLLSCLALALEKIHVHGHLNGKYTIANIGVGSGDKLEQLLNEMHNHFLSRKNATFQLLHETKEKPQDEAAPEVKKSSDSSKEDVNEDDLRKKDTSVTLVALDKKSDQPTPPELLEDLSAKLLADIQKNKFKLTEASKRKLLAEKSSTDELNIVDFILKDLKDEKKNATSQSMMSGLSPTLTWEHNKRKVFPGEFSYPENMTNPLSFFYHEHYLSPAIKSEDSRKAKPNEFVGSRDKP